MNPKRLSLAELKERVGQEVAVTDWFEVTQERVNQFAEVSGDDQWIHVDTERAKRESPYGVTIAHGFLTLSLLSQFMKSALEISGLRMGVNYGFNRVRFPAPVKVGARVRARFTLLAIKDVDGGGSEAAYQATVEAEGADKPCCVAEWLVRYY